MASILCCFVHFLWIYLIQPFPENDSVFSFYYPILNYLKASSLIGNDFSYITQYTHRGDYPLGSALLSYCLVMLSLDQVVLDYPYILSFLIVICICIIPLFFKHQNRWLLSLLIFTNPISMICMRALSPHGFIVFLAILSIFFLKNYLCQKNKNLNLFAFTLFNIISISLKHLGLIYFLCIVFAYAVFSSMNRQRDLKLISSLFISFFIGLSFYPLHGFQSYLTHLLEYKSYTNIKVVLTAIGLMSLCSIMFYFFSLKSKGSHRIPKILSAGLAYLILVILSCMFLYQGVYISLGATATILFIILVLFLVCSTRFKVNNVNELTSLIIGVSFICASLLFLSDIGRSFYVFFLPLLLLFIQFISKANSNFKLASILVIQILMSNFFPSTQYLKQKWGQQAELFPMLLFNSTHLNLFSWRSCEISFIRNRINQELKKMDLTDNNYLMIQENLHLYTQSVLYFPYSLVDSGPSFYRMDNQPNKILNQVLLRCKVNKKAVYKEYLKKGRFPLIMEGIKPFITLNNNHIGSMPELLKKNNPSLNEFAQSFSRDYLGFLKTSGSLDLQYEAIDIPTTNPVIRIYLLKSLYAPNSIDRKNLAETELIEEYKSLHQL